MLAIASEPFEALQQDGSGYLMRDEVRELQGSAPPARGPNDVQRRH